MYTVIVENDVSEWDDRTGVHYQFPKRYLELLTPGTKVIYYKGKLKDKTFANKRLSGEPHYFGSAVIKCVYPANGSDKALYAELCDFRPFKKAVLAKNNGGYLEIIPENRVSNFWRDGVRKTNKEVYEAILTEANS